MPRKRQPHTAPPAPPPVTALNQRKLDSRAEDSRLIAEALSGSDIAYKRLMEKYHDAIAAFIGRMIHDREQIEDLAQEAFIKAFSSLKSFNEEFAFSTWLYKIASNNCIDFIRKKKLQMLSIDKPVESRDSDYTFELPDETADVDQELIDGQRASLIARAIAELPEKYRRVIQMRHGDELSYEEIAEKLDLPIGTVKAHIFRARELLYKQLRHKIRQY